MKDDNLYESMGYTDMDLDGDIDIEDAILYDEMIETDIKHKNQHSDLDNDGEDIIDDNETEDEINDDGNIQSNTSKIKSISTSFRIKVEQKGFSTSIEDRKQSARRKLSDIKRYGERLYSDIEKRRCIFVLEDESLASNYCDTECGFLFLEAIKDNLNIPNEFYDFYQLNQSVMDFMPKLADYDMDIAIQVWAWLVKEFAPFKEIDADGVESITIYTLGYIESDMPKGFREKAYKYIVQHQVFFANVVKSLSIVIYDYNEFLYIAILNHDISFLNCLIDALLANKQIKLSCVFDVFEEVKENCLNYKNLYCIDIFSENIIPKLESLDNYILNKKIGKWKREINDYVVYMCSHYDEFAFSHIFAWRQKYKEESLSPIGFEREDEYLLAKNQKEEKKKTANELEEIIAECESILMDILDKGNYIDICDDKCVFNFAFNEKKYSYHKLWITILEKDGIYRHIGNDFVETRITVDNILQSIVIVWTSTELTQFCHNITHADNVDKQRDEINEINRPLMEYLFSHIRTFKLFLLENKAHSLGLNYFENPILKKAYRTRRDFEMFLYDKAKEIYGDYVASGEITIRWAMEQKMFALIKQLYKDAIYQYKADWLGNQSLDAYVPSLRIGFEYQGVQHYKPVEAFGGKSKFEKRQKLDFLKKEKCKQNGVRLVECKYDEVISKELLLKKVLEISNNF